VNLNIKHYAVQQCLKQPNITLNAGGMEGMKGVALHSSECLRGRGIVLV
jgi:hypothetical protein